MMGLPTQFQQCTRLVKEVPVYRLTKPDDQEALLESAIQIKALLRSF